MLRSCTRRVRDPIPSEDDRTPYRQRYCRYLLRFFGYVRKTWSQSGEETP
jgi:uncharacterized protein YchJ